MPPPALTSLTCPTAARPRRSTISERAVPLMWSTSVGVMQFVEQGKAKTLGVTTPQRVAILPTSRRSRKTRCRDSTSRPGWASPRRRGLRRMWSPGSVGHPRDHRDARRPEEDDGHGPKPSIFATATNIASGWPATTRNSAPLFAPPALSRTDPHRGRGTRRRDRPDKSPPQRAIAAFAAARCKIPAGRRPMPCLVQFGSDLNPSGGCMKKVLSRRPGGARRPARKDGMLIMAGGFGLCGHSGEPDQG